MSADLSWLNGWQRTPRGWALEAVIHRSPGWSTQLLPASWLLRKERLFEPSARPFERLDSRSFQLSISDLSKLSPLLQPGRLLAALVPPASRTRQAVYAAAEEGRQVYLPAALLLRELWALTLGAVEALLTPNSLALYLQRTDGADGLRVEVAGPMVRLAGSDTGLRRLCWLAQCADAQASWASVLTFAHDGSLRLRLPQVSLDAWAWGVELPTGTLVAELSAVSLSFELPHDSCRVQVGGVTHECPAAPERRTGFVTF